MDEAMFEKYAQHLEWEDFEEEVSHWTMNFVCEDDAKCRHYIETMFEEYAIAQ